MTTTRLRYHLSWIGAYLWTFTAIFAVGGTVITVRDGKVMDGVATVLVVVLLARFTWWLGQRPEPVSVWDD